MSETTEPRSVVMRGKIDALTAHLNEAKKKKTGINLNDFTRYMVAAYFPVGKRYSFTVVDVEIAQYYNRKERRNLDVPALVFAEKPQRLKLTSNMNKALLARKIGADADEWIGCKVVLERKADRSTMDTDSLQIVDVLAPTVASQPQTNSEELSKAASDDFMAGIGVTEATSVPKNSTEFWKRVMENKINKTAAQCAVENSHRDYGAAWLALTMVPAVEAAHGESEPAA